MTKNYSESSTEITGQPVPSPASLFNPFSVIPPRPLSDYASLLYFRIEEYDTDTGSESAHAWLTTKKGREKWPVLLMLSHHMSAQKPRRGIVLMKDKTLRQVLKYSPRSALFHITPVLLTSYEKYNKGNAQHQGLPFSWIMRSLDELILALPCFRFFNRHRGAHP